MTNPTVTAIEYIPAKEVQSLPRDNNPPTLRSKPLMLSFFMQFIFMISGLVCGAFKMGSIYSWSSGNFFLGLIYVVIFSGMYAHIVIKTFDRIDNFLIKRGNS